MSLATVTVDVPSTGEGLVADISALVGAKTVTLTGRFSGAYTLLASHNDVNFVPVLVFSSNGVESIRLTLPDSYKSVRLRSRAAALGPVTMSVKGASLPGENLFATLATFLTGTSGTSAVFDLATLFPPTGLEEGINIVCEGGLVGNLIVEGSQDNVAFNPLGSFQGGQFHRATTLLEFTPLSTGDQVRYLRFVLQGQAASNVVLTVGGRIPVGGGAGMPMPIFASRNDGSSYQAAGSPTAALEGANITVLGETHTVGGGCTSSVVGGASNTLQGANPSCVVIGATNFLGGGNASCAVLGAANNVASGSSSSVVTGTGNTLGGGCSNTVVSGVGNTLSASGSNNVVQGAGNVVSTSSSQVVGSGNTLNAGTSTSQVVGVSNTLGSGSSTCQVVGVSCSIGDGAPTCVLIGSTSTIGLGSTGAVSIGPGTSVGVGCSGSVTVGRATSVASLGGIAVGDGANVLANSPDSIAIGTGASVDPNRPGSQAYGAGALANQANQVVFGSAATPIVHFTARTALAGNPALLSFDSSIVVANHDSAMSLLYKNALGNIVNLQVKVDDTTGMLYVPL